jgi:hypothetical protein
MDVGKDVILGEYAEVCTGDWWSDGGATRVGGAVGDVHDITEGCLFCIVPDPVPSKSKFCGSVVFADAAANMYVKSIDPSDTGYW